MATHGGWRKGLGVGTAVALMTALAGCGSSSGSDSGSSSSGSGSGAGAGTSAAQTTVHQYSQPLTSFDVPPLTTTPAPGKKVVIVVNNIPESQYIKEGAVDGAKLLGWTPIPIVFDPSDPTGATDAFAQAVADHPDAVITQAINATDYAAAAKTFASEHIPVVTSNNTDPVAPPIVANVADPSQYERAGKIMASYAVAQKGDKASVAMFNIPSFPILQVYETAFKNEFLKLCPTCHYESHAVQASDIGTKVPQQVVSAVQRTPSINFASMGFGAVATGVSAALASAGLQDQTKIIGIQPTTENLKAIAAGTEEAWLASPITGMGWTSIDALARYFNKGDVAVSTSAQIPFQLITKDNAEATLPRAEVDGGDYEGIFKKLWLVQ